MINSAVEFLVYTEAVGGSNPSSPMQLQLNTMVTVRCKQCNRELTSSSKFQTCGCPNMTSVVGDNITAVDLSKVVLTKSENTVNKHGALTNQDLQYQEERRKRKVRKLDFEER